MKLYEELPSDIQKSQQPIFKKIINFFKDKFRKQPKMLPEGTEEQPTTKTIRLDNVKLTSEQMQQYRIGENDILKQYNNENQQLEYNDQREGKDMDL